MQKGAALGPLSPPDGAEMLIQEKYTRIGLYCRMSPYELGAWERKVVFFRWKVRGKA